MAMRAAVFHGQRAMVVLGGVAQEALAVVHLPVSSESNVGIDALVRTKMGHKSGEFSQFFSELSRRQGAEQEYIEQTFG